MGWWGIAKRLELWSPQTRLRTRLGKSNGHRGTFSGCTLAAVQHPLFYCISSKHAMPTGPSGRSGTDESGCGQIARRFPMKSCCDFVSVQFPTRRNPKIEPGVRFSAPSNVTNTICSRFVHLHASDNAYLETSLIRKTGGSYFPGCIWQRLFLFCP